MDSGSPKSDRPPGAGRLDARQVAAAALARREDFRLGEATIQPSLRRIAGPRDQVNVEPRVMQVLVAFADSGGTVLTREDLMRQCWSGMVVGDDAIVRTIAEIRRVARRTEGGFGIETIARVGYRLTVSARADDPAPERVVRETTESPLSPQVPPNPPLPPPAATRRWVLATGAGVGLVLGGALLLPSRTRTDPRVVQLLAEGEAALRWSTNNKTAQARDSFRQAIDLDPDSASAWGWLALAWALLAEGNTPEALVNCRTAAMRAQQIDPRESNAQLAMILASRRSQDDWYATEQKLKAFAHRHQDNFIALQYLSLTAQSAGHTDDSIAWTEKLSGLDEKPTASTPIPLVYQALKFWILGNEDGALGAIHDAWNHWEKASQFAWTTQLILVSFIARPHRTEQVRYILEAAPAVGMDAPKGKESWLLGVSALDSGSDSDAADAVTAIAADAHMHTQYKVMFLSQLGRPVEAHSEFRKGFGYIQTDATTAVQGSASAHNPRWRRWEWLWTPPMKAFRSDVRFGEWARLEQLEEYWNKTKPPDEGVLYRHT
jgi:DNA-binding winged helix-turn-helix (wHTH) protein/tetratricopeptide (TPR) repeat protein